MGHFDTEIIIAAPQERVFDYLSDVENTPGWYSAVQSAEIISGYGPGLNSQYRIVRNLPQGRTEDIVRVTEFDRPHLFRFGTSQGATPFSYQYEVTKEDQATRVTLHAEISLSGPSKLLSPIASQVFKRGMVENLRVLATMLERS